ncbi:MAG: hypothetical protein HY770_01745 [Chitinivibrionia bacterium]|nr:hypothetical protein [Chitinivibrionia bacterium]
MKKVCCMLLTAAVAAATLFSGVPARSAEREPVEAFATASPRPGSAERVFFYNASGGEREAMAFKDSLIERGAFHVNAFLPDYVVCELPDGVDVQELLAGSGFSYVKERDILRSGAGESFPGMGLIAGSYALARELNQASAAPSGEGLPADGRYGFRDSVVVVPPELQQLPPHILSMFEGDEDVRLTNQNSEFLLGNILVLTIFPESQNGPESWSTEELSGAKMGVYAAMLNYQETFDYATINFTFKLGDPSATSYEPIQYEMSTDHLWINDVMRRLGYTPGHNEAISTVHAFNEYWRKHYAGAIDWVFTAFVANSEYVYNHRFNDGNARYTAYANLGGPYLVIPYPAGENPYQIDEVLVFSQIFQHEACHVFWALDEYLSEAVSTCHDRSGYLNYENLNKIESLDPVYGNPSGCQELVPCIMAEAKQDLGRPICFYTQGQLGVVDRNDNSIPDVFDSAPIIAFENSDIETVLTSNVSIRARAVSVPVSNRNPVFENNPLKKAYACVLKDALLNVDGTGNLYLIPEDGRWDEPEEEIAFNLSGLSTGLTRVQLKTRTKVGLNSATYTKRIYNLGLNFSFFTVVVKPAGISLSWNMIGETFAASFDLWRISFASGSPDTVLLKEGILPSGPPQNQFLPFDYLDADVEPGVAYQYFVEGSYLVRFTSRSGPVAATAMLPIAASNIVSQVMPNPFDPRRENLMFSILVPPSYRDTGASSSRPSSGREHDVPDRASAIKVAADTPLDVAIFDVAGRLVKIIESKRLYAQAVTYAWNGTNDNNDPVPSGIYFLRAVAGPSTQVRKIVLLR